MTDQAAKDLRNLYLKGYLVGDECNIKLREPVGSRDADGSYCHLAEKDSIVHAKIVKNGKGEVVYQIIFEFQTVFAPLSHGKVR